MSFVCAALVIDHLIGSYVHKMIKKDFTWKKNLHGFLIKGFSVVAGYVLFEMMHQIVDDVDFISTYFKITLQLIVFMYPAGSALVNISIASGGKFPSKGIMEKFVKFENTADLETFKTKQNEENINNQPIYNDVGVDASILPEQEESNSVL